jgi:tetratricopeptide (TPR) repeat protein
MKSDKFLGGGLKMGAFIAFVVFSLNGIAFADDQINQGPPGDKHLVEIEYDVGGRYTVSRWLSEKHNGVTRFLPDHSTQSESVDDPGAQMEAGECLELLKAVDEPKDLPDAPAEMVTVRCADGAKTRVKRFPVGSVPQQVRQMLAIMGYASDRMAFDHLKFMATPEDVAAAKRRADLEELSSQADTAYHRQDYTKAIECWSEMLKIDPNDATTYYKRATGYAAYGEPDQVAADCAEAIRLDPKNEEAYKLRAITYRKKGMREKAIEALDEWIKFNPKAAQAYEERAQRYMWKDDDKMIADLTQAIALHAAGIGEVSGDDYQMRGEAYIRKGEKEKAIADLTQAIAIYPEAGKAYGARADLYYDQGEYDKAFADYDKAIQFGHGDLNDYISRGYAYYHRGEWANAIADADTVERLKPGWWNAFVLRGKVYAAQGIYDKAQTEYNKLLEADPKDAPGKNAAAWLYATCPDAKYRDGAKAVDLAMQACMAGSWHWDEWIDTLAAAYAETGDYDKAVDYEKLAIKTAGDNAKVVKIYNAHMALYAEKKPLRVEKVNDE